MEVKNNSSMSFPFNEVSLAIKNKYPFHLELNSYPTFNIPTEVLNPCVVRTHSGKDYLLSASKQQNKGKYEVIYTLYRIDKSIIHKTISLKLSSNFPDRLSPDFNYGFYYRTEAEKEASKKCSPDYYILSHFITNDPLFEIFNRDLQTSRSDAIKILRSDIKGAEEAYKAFTCKIPLFRFLSRQGVPVPDFEFLKHNLNFYKFEHTL